MKKLLLIIAVMLFGFNVNAQDGLRGGISAGLPIGDAGDGYSFSVLLDLSYLWEVSDSFDVGLATGYSHSFGESIDFGGGSFKLDDASFLPVAVAGRLGVSDEFTIGADVGYAIGISPDGNDGGFYYAPKLQYSVSDSIDIVFAYRGVSVDGGSFDIISLGVEFGL